MFTDLFVVLCSVVACLLCPACPVGGRKGASIDENKQKKFMHKCFDEQERGVWETNDPANPEREKYNRPIIGPVQKHSDANKITASIQSRHVHESRVKALAHYLMTKPAPADWTDWPHSEYKYVSDFIQHTIEPILVDRWASRVHSLVPSFVCLFDCLFVCLFVR